MSAKLQRTLTKGMLDNVTSGLFAKLALDVADLKCDFIAINFIALMRQIVQEFSDNGYVVAGLEQLIDDDKLGQAFYQSEFHVH